MFINTKKDFVTYIKDSKKPLMANYYKQTRKKLNILIEKNGTPTEVNGVLIWKIERNFPHT